MKKIWVILQYTFKESLRNKAFLVLLYFTGIAFAASLLFSVLGQEEEYRMLRDTGWLIIELFSLTTAIYSGVTILLEEIENKTIYFIITRPVLRWQYLVGRYGGIMSTVVISTGLMLVIHTLLILLRCRQMDYIGQITYFLCLNGKIGMILAVSFFFALFSTSAISSLTFTLFFWILGHFSVELKFFILQFKSIIGIFISKLVYYTIPQFHYFDFLNWDKTGSPHFFPVFVVIYTFVYISVLLTLSSILFARKEA